MQKNSEELTTITNCIAISNKVIHNMIAKIACDETKDNPQINTVLHCIYKKSSFRTSSTHDIRSGAEPLRKTLRLHVHGTHKLDHVLTLAQQNVQKKNVNRYQCIGLGNTAHEEIDSLSSL